MVKRSDYEAYAHDSEHLLEVVQKFCEDKQIAESTFGRLAVNDGKFVQRLSNGGRIALDTARRVAVFMQKVEAGKIILRGRPRRKHKEVSNSDSAELISTETSLRTPGSFAYYEQRQRQHTFFNTTNESWALAERVTADLAAMEQAPDVFRLFYAPMDNGVALTRILRAFHAYFPATPVVVVLKGRGLEDLRNTVGRLVDRLVEHPLSVFVLSNMYLWETLKLAKVSSDNPLPLQWDEMALDATHSYAMQSQVVGLYNRLSDAWLVESGEHNQPIYAKPSVVTLFRQDKQQLADIIPQQGGKELEFDYAVLNHAYLHSHTTLFKTQYVLQPMVERLAPGGQLLVVQAHGNDPAHAIVKQRWPDEHLHIESRYDVIKALQVALGENRSNYSFSGLTENTSLFRFDMHTLPLVDGRPIGRHTLASVWNNAVYFTQLDENKVQAAMHQDDDWLSITEAVLNQSGGLWFVDETFMVTRKASS